MIAIVGALILLDRLVGNWFDTIVVLMAPIVIIMYSAIYSFKDSILVAIGVLVVTFIFGNTDYVYLIYMPVGVLTGIAYAYALSKNVDRRTLMFISIIVYTIGEFAATFIIYPLLGLPIVQQLAEMKELMNQMNYAETFEMVGLSADKVLIVMLLVSTVLLGIMEGILIHILTIFLFKRFRIKDIGVINIWDLKPNPPLAYVCFISMFSFFLNKYISNETLYYIMFGIGIFGAMILIYFGYIFLLLYCRIVLKKNYAPFVVLLAFFIPVILFGLIILGFLYGSGPLRNYLEDKINQQQTL